MSDERFRGRIRLQATDVTRPIIAIRRLNEQGHYVTFWHHRMGGTIKNAKTSQAMTSVRKGGGFFLRMWVWVPPCKDVPKSVFNRQGS